MMRLVKFWVDFSPLLHAKSLQTSTLSAHVVCQRLVRSPSVSKRLQLTVTIRGVSGEAFTIGRMTMAMALPKTPN